MHTKDISGWSVVKTNLDKELNRPDVKIGEVRWCAIGHNIGSEIDGKGELYSRPVVVIGYISTNTRLVLPLTHSDKLGKHLLEIEFIKEKVKARLDQVRIVDVKRLKDRLGELSENKVNNLKIEIQNFVFR